METQKQSKKSTSKRNNQSSSTSAPSTSQPQTPLTPKTIEELQELFERHRLSRTPIKYHLRNVYWRVTNVALGCLQNMTLGGVLYGWTSVSSSLLIATDGGPGLDQATINSIFVTANFFSFLGPLFIGVVLDMYGPRTASLLSLTLVCFGFALFAASNTHSFNFFLPAMSLIAFGGPGIQTCLFHLSNLFPNYKSTVTSLINGSFQISFAAFYVLDQLWYFDGWTYQELFFVCACLAMCNMGISMVMWPDKPYSYEEQLHSAVSVPELNHIDGSVGVGVGVDIDKGHETAESKSNVHEFATVRTQLLKTHIKEGLVRAPSLLGMIDKHDPETTCVQGRWSLRCCLPESEDVKSLKDASLTQQLLSGPFLMLGALFVVASFWGNFYIAVLGTELADTLPLSSHDLRLYGRKFSATLTACVVVVPIVGMCMDKLGFTVTAAVVCIFGLLWALMNIGAMMIDDSAAVPITPGGEIDYNDSLHESANSLVLWSFLSYSLFRTFLYPFVFAYIADICGYKYFGVLGGVLFVCGAIASVFTIPLSLFAQGNCHTYVSTLTTAGGDGDGAGDSSVNKNFETCNHGIWKGIFLLIAISFAALLLAFPAYDWYYRRTHGLNGASSRAAEDKAGYGAVSTQEDGTNKDDVGTELVEGNFLDV